MDLNFTLFDFLTDVGIRTSRRSWPWTRRDAETETDELDSGEITAGIAHHEFHIGLE